MDFGGISPLRTGFNTYLLMVTLPLSVGLFHHLQWNFIASGLWYWLSPHIVEMHDVDFRTVWRILPIALQWVGWHPLVFSVFLIITSEDQVPGDGIGAWLAGYLKKLGKLMNKSWPDFQIGVNAGNPAMELLGDVVEVIREMYEIFTNDRSVFLRPSIVATKIRDIGLADHIEEEGEGCPLPANEVLDMERKNVDYNRRLIILASMVIMVFYWEAYLGAVIFTMTIVYSILGLDDQSPVMSDRKELMISDGVYRLSKRWMWFTLESTIGVCTEGVMHGCYHGCHSLPLVVGRRLYERFYVSVVADLITWGGIPRMTLPKEGDTIYVNREHETYRHTMEVSVRVDETQRAFTWLGNSKPGESGSPIWIMRDGALMLAGLVGRWCVFESRRTEISVHPIVYDISKDNKGNVVKIVKHPGYGKTFKDIPAIVATHMAHGQGKIMILGPTRIVARELYNSLTRNFKHIGLSMKGENNRRNPRAKIQVTTHATFIRMLMKGSLEIKGIHSIVIDEAHVDDQATKMARGYGRFLATQGGVSYELSATLDGQHDDNSNFNITDYKMKSNADPVKLVKELASQGKRVLMFVPGHQGKTGAIEMMKKIKCDDIKVLVLTRNTYLEAGKDINNEDYNVVVATNIAECGLNIKCDVVVDTGIEFSYFESDEIVTGQMVKRSTASRVQRRGRTGRNKPGEYYYWESGNEEPSRRASEYDSEAMLGGRSWSPPGIDTKWILSDEQVILALEKGWSPRYVKMLYGIDGTPLSKINREKAISEWLKGEKVVTDCGCGHCGGKYTWYDERHHDELVALKRGIVHHEGKTRIDL